MNETSRPADSNSVLIKLPHQYSIMLSILRWAYSIAPFQLVGPARLDEGDPQLDFSFIVHTHPRSQDVLPFEPIPTFLTALMEQTPFPLKFELVIIQDGPETPDVRKAIEEARDRLHIQYEATGVRRPMGWLRNRGLERSRGRAIVMIDDDALPAPDFLSALSEVIVQPEFADSFLQTSWLPRYGLLQSRCQYTMEYGNSCGCVVYPRTLARRLGGYLPFLKAYDDVDFFFRTVLVGYQVFHAPGLRYYHAPFYSSPTAPRTRERGRLYGRAMRALRRVYSLPVWLLLIINEIKKAFCVILPSQGLRSHAWVAIFTLAYLFKSDPES